MSPELRRLLQPAQPVVSSTVPDYSREAKRFFAWHPSRSLIASIRAHQRAGASRSPLAALARRWAGL
ncbi:MAG TPA: hypothetical protein VF169_25470, partial [Albitalea sp.]